MGNFKNIKSNMCCTKKCCGRYVFIVSFVLMVLGLAPGLYGYFGIDIEETWTLGSYTVPSPTALFGILAIIVGIFVVVTGIFGALAGYYKMPCFTLPFQIFVIIVSICMLIIAGLALAGAGAKDELTKSICKNEGGDPITVGGEVYASLEEFE